MGDPRKNDLEMPPWLLIATGHNNGQQDKVGLVSLDPLNHPVPSCLRTRHVFPIKTWASGSARLNEGETLGIRNAIILQTTYGIDRIGAMTFSLHDAVSDREARKELVSLMAQIDGIRELILDHLVPALGLNLGFNAQDGD